MAGSGYRFVDRILRIFRQRKKLPPEQGVARQAVYHPAGFFFLMGQSRGENVIHDIRLRQRIAGLELLDAPPVVRLGFPLVPQPVRKQVGCDPQAGRSSRSKSFVPLMERPG